ncbi:MAG: ATP-binding cassette domain-containing protein [Prevotella sp.]|nr:ATP-binding cassette domain-containing protein [Prevotella sp.]
MNTISFQRVLPHVFAQAQELESEVWSRELTLEKGHLYLLEASSGKGKSTFCSYIAGYRHDFSGDLLFDHQSVSQYSVRQWVDVRRSQISLLFQELRLFPELTALENVEIKNQLTHWRTRRQILECFEELQIADKADQKVGRMSFGQQQRVALIRALMQPFDFLLADEPISHLDDANAHVMGNLMMREAQQQGAAVIVTSIGKHMNLPYEKIIKL